MLRIVMDGAGDMPAGWAEMYDIQVIPLQVQLKEQTYQQGTDLEKGEFYRLVAETGEIPQTRPPSPQELVEFYKSIAEPGDRILSVHVTRTLSGIFASAQAAASELFGQYHIIPFDSAGGSAAMGYLCREARLLDRAGYSIERILQRLEDMRRHLTMFLTLNNLSYARRSMRMRSLQAAWANFLHLKPVVALYDGALEIAGRVLTRRHALENMLENVRRQVGKTPVNVAVFHAQDPSAGESLVEKVKSVLNCQDLIVTDLSIAVAANLGPGTVGIVAYPVEEG